MTVDDDRTAAPAAGPARKTATRKTAARKAPAKKAPAKKAAAKKSPAKNAAAKKAPAQRAPQRAAATKAPAKKAAPKAVEQPGTTTPEDPPSAVAPVEDPSDGPTPDLTTVETAQTVPRPRSIVTVAVSALTAAALVFAVVAAVVWWRADHDAARHRGLTRDRALLAARVGIQTVSTSDYRHSGATLDAWLSVSTGTLAEQFNQSRASATKLLGEAKVITTATVLDAAVVTLNVGKGTATVIASVNLRKQPASGAAATSRNRLRASLTRVKGRWKISDLQVVSVRLS